MNIEELQIIATSLEQCNMVHKKIRKRIRNIGRSNRNKVILEQINKYRTQTINTDLNTDRFTFATYIYMSILNNNKQLFERLIGRIKTRLTDVKMRNPRDTISTTVDNIKSIIKKMVLFINKITYISKFNSRYKVLQKSKIPNELLKKIKNYNTSMSVGECEEILKGLIITYTNDEHNIQNQMKEQKEEREREWKEERKRELKEQWKRELENNQWGNNQYKKN